MVWRHNGPIVDFMPTDEGTDMTTTEPLRASAASVFTARQMAIVCELLGVPRDDRLSFWRWAGDLSNTKAMDELHAYVDVMIADRCRKPGDDLLSQLIQLEIDGDELTVDDVHRFVTTLVAGQSHRQQMLNRPTRQEVEDSCVCSRKKLSPCRPSRA
jgi:cytochrome P450